MERFDLAVIGGGLACTTTLCSMITELTRHPPTSPLKIAVIEKHEQLWTGMAYGPRSDINSLTITSLKDFLTDDTEREFFIDWLKQNLQQWLTTYEQRGGLTARRWVQANLKAIWQNKWDELYLPRYLFGQYQAARLQNLLAGASGQLLNVFIINAEATSAIVTAGKEYQIELKNKDSSFQYICAQKLLLACGSLPIKELQLPPVPGNGHICVQNIYQPSAYNNVADIKQALAAFTGKSRILIVGANASAMEFLYLLYRSPVVRNYIKQIVIVAPGGRLPGRVITQEHKHFDCRNLYKLIREKKQYHVNDLLQAAMADLYKVTSNGVYIPLVSHFMNYVLKLMKPMPDEQKRLLYTHYGHLISKIIRRAGPAYRRAVSSLVKQQKLYILKGSFAGLMADDTGEHNGLRLKYKSSKSHKIKLSSSQFRVVVNCSGSVDIATTSSTLISSLINKEIVKPNGSGKGLQVNENFEAAANLYVMGPLLGGNMNTKIHFWHLESASRLLYLAPMLARELLKNRKAVPV